MTLKTPKDFDDKLAILGSAFYQRVIWLLGYSSSECEKLLSHDFKVFLYWYSFPVSFKCFRKEILTGDRQNLWNWREVVEEYTGITQDSDKHEEIFRVLRTYFYIFNAIVHAKKERNVVHEAVTVMNELETNEELAHNFSFKCQLLVSAFFVSCKEEGYTDERIEALKANALGDEREKFELYLFWYSYGLPFEEFTNRFLSAEWFIKNWINYLASIRSLNHPDILIITKVMQEYFPVFTSIARNDKY